MINKNGQSWCMDILDVFVDKGIKVSQFTVYTDKGIKVSEFAVYTDKGIKVSEFTQIKGLKYQSLQHEFVSFKRRQ